MSINKSFNFQLMEVSIVLGQMPRFCDSNLVLHAFLMRNWGLRRKCLEPTIMLSAVYYLPHSQWASCCRWCFGSLHSVVERQHQTKFQNMTIQLVVKFILCFLTLMDKTALKERFGILFAQWVLLGVGYCITMSPT